MACRVGDFNNEAKSSIGLPKYGLVISMYRVGDLLSGSLVDCQLIHFCQKPSVFATSRLGVKLKRFPQFTSHR